MSGRVGSITTDIIADGLIFNMDAANRASYVPGATTSYNTLNLSNSGSLENDIIFSPDNQGSWLLDGLDEAIDFGDLEIVEPKLNSFTCNVFFKAENTSGVAAVIVGKGNGSSNIRGWNMYYASGNGLTVRCCGETNLVAPFNQRAQQINDTLIDNQIYMGTVVINRENNTLRGYVNGSNDNFVDISGTPSDITGFDSIEPTEDFAIGCRFAFGTTVKQLFFPGNIYSVSCYNRALTQEEILQNYNALKGRFGL